MREGAVRRSQIAGAIQAKRQGPLQRLEALVRWMHRGYEHANAGDLAAAVAYNALVALIPTLLLTLSMTPLQRLSGWGGWIAVRRQLGLWCFTYAVLHLSAYAVFLVGLDVEQLLVDLRKRPYIIVGMLTFIGLLMLALTSNRFSIRRLGKRWKALHRLVYPILLLALLHMLWVVRADLGEWLLYAVIGAFLWLFVRLKSAEGAASG